MRNPSIHCLHATKQQRKPEKALHSFQTCPLNWRCHELFSIAHCKDASAQSPTAAVQSLKQPIPASLSPENPLGGRSSLRSCDSARSHALPASTHHPCGCNACKNKRYCIAVEHVFKMGLAICLYRLMPDCMCQLHNVRSTREQYRRCLRVKVLRCMSVESHCSCGSMCAGSSAGGFVLPSSAAVVDGSVGATKENEELLSCAAPISCGASLED